MALYLLRRLVQAPLVLLIIVTLSFFFVRLAPGGPFSAERRLDPVVESALRARYHLDEALPLQYLRYVRDLLRGDLGPSFKQRSRSVNEIIAQGLPVSALLGCSALFIAILAGMGAGFVSAMRRASVWDRGAMLTALIGLSVPTFVIGPILQMLFSIHAKVLPLAGYEGAASPQYLLLPAITLALPFAARIARLARAGLLDVLNQDFIRTARAKGLSEIAVLFRHALRGGVFPVVSFLGPATAQIMTGSLVVEKIFQIPGLGREFVESALSRDYTLIMGLVVVYGVMLVACNLAVDIAYGLLDPRVRYK